MLRVLPFSLVVLTAISFMFCSITIALTFLNLEMTWANFVAGALTAFYHLLVVVLAWFRMSRRKHHHAGTDDIQVKIKSERGVPPSLASLESKFDDDHAMVPYPIVVITFGAIIIAVWIIAFGMTIDVAVKGFHSTLASGLSNSKHIDRTGLLGSSFVIAVEVATMIVFVWCCVKGQRQSSDRERDLLEDNLFYSTSPKLGRFDTLKSLRRTLSMRSTRSNGQAGRSNFVTAIEPPLPPAPVVLPFPTHLSMAGRGASPGEMVTPRVPSMRAAPAKILPSIPEDSPPLKPLRRTQDSMPRFVSELVKEGSGPRLPKFGQ
ncbi:hypothetical protein D9756_002072 [Leucocoprinus leucothites]|uniref:Uncharacterized protein n=1 Tax=Leucocoprinus leucothites TaxID=201217 RepID=A0A8H5GBF2_9AGAR|nr:hypothetical protein D9756_002072 [Leucoagaricus leucothites]